MAKIKVHFTHRFSKDSRLEMMEYNPNEFMVTYLTQEGTDEDGREMWYSNNSDNSDNYKSFNAAKEGFIRRRNSVNPFYSSNVFNK
jgi:hypothetical protein